MKKTTLMDVTFNPLRLRLVHVDESDSDFTDEHPTLSGMRCAADAGAGGVTKPAALRKCLPEVSAFPFRKIWRAK